MVESMLFVHAVTDCETTSAVHRKGTGEMLSPFLTPICSLILILSIVTVPVELQGTRLFCKSWLAGMLMICTLVYTGISRVGLGGGGGGFQKSQI